MNPFFFPRLGGIERRIYHLGRELVRQGHEITVLTGGNGKAIEEETMDGMRVVRLPARNLPIKWDPPVQFTRGVRKALIDLKPDLVDYHYRWAPEWTRAVIQSGAPWVFTWHNQYGEGSGPLRVLSLLNDAGYRRHVQRGARRIVCISDFIRDELQGREFDPALLAVVPNGSQRPDEDGPEWQPDDGRAAPERPYLMAVGRLTPEKGNDLVLRAFARAIASGSDARLVLCGRGPERAALERLATQLGIADRVTFGGWVPEATKWRLFAGAAALLHMARFESYGIAIAEAIVAGLPVVAADVGGVAEVVGDAGLLVPAQDVEAAGDGVALLLRDAELRETLVARARARGPSMAWREVAQKMGRLYEEAAS